MRTREAFFRRRRGVVMVHVLMCLALMAWVATMMLQWTLNRHLSEKLSIDGDQDRVHLAALQAQIYTCLQAIPNYPPTTTCPSVDPVASGCLPSRIEGRPFAITFCPGNGKQACRILVNICRQDDTSCPAPPLTGC
ncbi:MAG TPA: hypothetical protein DCM05_00885 [Elusimicrobia bacterium]|nr:hypothetical protein [Elusimicrobiota bacterium]